MADPRRGRSAPIPRPACGSGGWGIPRVSPQQRGGCGQVAAGLLSVHGVSPCRPHSARVRGAGSQQSVQPLRVHLLRRGRRVERSAVAQVAAKMSLTFSWYLAEHSK